MLNLEIQIQTQAVPENFQVHRQQHAFYLVYPKSNGTVVSLNQPTISNTINHHFEFTTNIGDRHHGCSSNVDLSAYVIAWDKDWQQLEQCYYQLGKFKPINYQLTDKILAPNM